MKKKFLTPITALALSVLGSLTANAEVKLENQSELSSLEQELIRIKNLRVGMTKEEFLKPFDNVLMAETVSKIDDIIMQHRSHASHRSHRSHFSSYR